MRNRNQAQNSAQEPPKERGRPATIRASEVYGRAENFRGILNQVWDRLWPLLSNAQSEEDVTKAFQEGARPYDQNFVPSLSPLLLKVLKEPTLPKRPKAMQRFIADSVAGVGVVTGRRSRDICAQERVTRKRAHHIIRYEFYIECSCAYEGHSVGHACPKCGTKILFPVTLGSHFP
jgi:hypothetical protein